ncbi:MAG: hypothetical protein Q9208_006903 [Pyrenodesmia sp. 3 TL-2023]
MISCISVLVAGFPPEISTELHNGSAPLDVSGPSNALRTYLVYPFRPEDTEKVQEVIESQISKDLVTVVKSTRPQHKGVLFWSVELDEVSELYLRQSLSTYADVVSNEPKAVPQSIATPHTNATITRSTLKLGVGSEGIRLQHQMNAPIDLKVVSWRPDKRFADQRSYTYVGPVQEETYIYVIDQGLDPSYPVSGTPQRVPCARTEILTQDFEQMLKGPVTWHWPVFLPNKGKTKTDDGGAHGSCVASKAAGWLNGVSKYSHLAMLKVDFTARDMIWAFNQIAEDIAAKGRQRRSIVVLAAVWVDNYVNRAFKRIRPAIQDLFDLQAVVVVPAGNFRKFMIREDVDTLPALWESDAFPLIVVGAVDNEGDIADFSQGGRHVTAWAPGVEISCSGSDLVTTTFGTGTSFSTGMVRNTSFQWERTLLTCTIRSPDWSLIGWVPLIQGPRPLSGRELFFAEVCLLDGNVQQLVLGLYGMAATVVV